MTYDNWIAIFGEASRGETMGVSETDGSFPWRFVAAPMADLSHAGFRVWCERYGGADLYFTEMIGARALLYGSPYESWYTETEPVPDKTVYQLWGVHEDDFFGAARKLTDKPVLGIDINMGCSAPQIRLRGGGIGLMDNLDKAARIIEGVRRILKGKTVSAKIRIGEREDPESLVSFARKLENAGADWITLNPRIRKDKHRRPGRWAFVKLLKGNLGIPVIGNGDITDLDSFIMRRNQSEADAFMIGRSSIQNPWIFSTLRDREEQAIGPVRPSTTNIDLEDSVFSALSLIEQWQPQDFHVRRARRFLSLWSRNLKYGNQLLKDITTTDSIAGMRALLTGYFNRNSDERSLQI
jgi:tRNA-dihydrouridine synthase B